MQVVLVRVLASILARLSLPANHRVGAALGWIAWVSRSSVRRVTEVNLRLCFPQWSEQQRAEVARASLIETGKALTESFWIWQRPPHQIETHIVATEGGELLDAALQSTRGLMVATPHLGSWELCNLPLSREKPITYLYRPPRFKAIEPLLIRWRANLNAQPARLDQAGIKSVLRTLKDGNIIGVLPDQEPDEKNGEFAPLFNVPANTMTLMAKLANRSDAIVLFCWGERLPRGQGWRIHYLEPEPGIDSRDKLIATRALNKTVERCLTACPSQYMWNYKRFRRMPDGTRRPYKS